MIVYVINNTFAGNIATSGGAISVTKASGSITGNVFVNNVATGDGGAIYLHQVREGIYPLVMIDILILIVDIIEC